MSGDFPYNPTRDACSLSGNRIPVFGRRGDPPRFRVPKVAGGPDLQILWSEIRLLSCIWIKKRNQSRSKNYLAFLVMHGFESVTPTLWLHSPKSKWRKKQVYHHPCGCLCDAKFRCGILWEEGMWNYLFLYKLILNKLNTEAKLQCRLWQYLYLFSSLLSMVQKSGESKSSILGCGFKRQLCASFCFLRFLLINFERNPHNL